MSETQQTPAEFIPAEQAAPPTPQAPAADPGKGRGLSTFLKVSIILLAALSLASISLLFIGDFEGKFERVFSTFLAFAVFVGLTAFDTRKEQRYDWYAPVALLANSYILALLLIVIWMTPVSWALTADIFWKSLVVVIVTRAVVGCAQLLLRFAEGKPKPLGVFALITSLFATLSGILFTAPIAIEVFRVNIPELYWKFAVAALLLTALGLAITLLLRWAYTGEEREAGRRIREAEHATQAVSHQLAGFPGGVPGAGQPASPAAPIIAVAPAPAAGAAPLLPWPTYADGTPLPPGPDGQPDFSARQRR